MIAERQTTITRDLPSPLPRRPSTAPSSWAAQTGHRIPRPMGERGPRVVRRVRALSWGSPMTSAVLVASFLVCLASLYVAAYARIAMQSVEKAQLTRELRAGTQLEEILHGEVSELTLSSMVKKRAVDMKMEPNSTQSTDLLLSADSGNSLAAGQSPSSNTAISNQQNVQ